MNKFPLHTDPAPDNTYRFDGKFTQWCANDDSAFEEASGYHDDRAATVERCIDGVWCSWCVDKGWLLPSGAFHPFDGPTVVEEPLPVYIGLFHRIGAIKAHATGTPYWLEIEKIRQEADKGFGPLESTLARLEKLVGLEPNKHQHQFHDREDELAHCKVCNGAEGSLPTDCPGVELTEEQQELIYVQKLDYRDGQWVGTSTPPQPCPRESWKYLRPAPEPLPLAQRVTQGPVKYSLAEGLCKAPKDWGLRYEIVSPDLFIGFTLEEKDAKLIAEAFNVAHETGLTPRQLRDQRAELIAALKRSQELLVAAYSESKTGSQVWEHFPLLNTRNLELLQSLTK